MRRKDHIFELQQFVIVIRRFFVKRIECEAANTLRAQCIEQRAAVHDVRIRYVYDACVRLHAVEFVMTKNVSSSLGHLVVAG